MSAEGLAPSAIAGPTYCKTHMCKFAEATEAIAGTTKKLLKTGIVADYLKSRSVDEAALSAVFLSGRPFPAWEETTLQVGGRLLWGVVAELSGRSEAQLSAAYRTHGDLGAVAGEVLPQGPRPGGGVLDGTRGVPSCVAD